VTRLAFAALGARLARLRERELVYFGGCGYLGLAHRPEVLEALREGTARYGWSLGASLETSGCSQAHAELELALASWLGLEEALLFPGAALANLGALQVLCADGRALLCDAGAHASLRGLRALATGGAHEHAHLDARAALAQRARIESSVLWCGDGVYPAERARAPLAECLRALRPGDLALVDDCHALGLLGAHGRGSAAELAARQPELLVSGTFSKALGGTGGFLAGARELVQRVRARSSAYLGSSPIPAAAAHANRVALELARGAEAERARLRALGARLERVLRAHEVALGPEPLPVFAFTLEPHAAARAAADFESAGLLVPWVEYPGGPAPGYFRLVLNAAHTDEDVERVCAVLARVLAAHAGEQRTRAQGNP